MKVTIRQVAQRAGVSITTASRALNGHSDVKESTRRRVQAIARNLDYVPNRAARQLVMGTTALMGIYLRDDGLGLMDRPFFLHVICGLRDRLAEFGYDVLWLSRKGDNAQKSLTTLCRERGVAGLAVMGLDEDDAEVRELSAGSLPCVGIDCPLSGRHACMVSTDNMAGARVAVEHLLQLPRRRILFVNGHSAALVSRQRLAGFSEAMARAGLPVDPDRIADGAFRSETAQDVVAAALGRFDIDAIFCASDEMAAGSLQALANAGRRVPQDVAVVGFDDLPFASALRPALTTIRQEPFEMGRCAAELLHASASDRAYLARSVTLTPKLVMRDSA